MKTLLQTLFFFSLAIQICFAQNIIYVDMDAQGAGNGTSWEDAFTSLVEALYFANQNDQIWVAEGIYTPGTTRTESFKMKYDVALFGGFDGTEVSLEERDWNLHLTILSGDIGVLGQVDDNCYHVIENTTLQLDSNAVLDGFIITDGNANGTTPDDRGAGMLNIQAEPTVRNCIFERNSATERGGGVYNSWASPKFLDCIIRANSAFEGGGMTNYRSSPLLLRVNFLGNYGAYGGGLCNEIEASPLVEDCIFELNQVYDTGGAVSLHEGCNAIFRRCIFRSNIASAGTAGAIWHRFTGLEAHPLYVECLFELNYKGVLAMEISTVRIENSIFVNNFNPNQDGGVLQVRDSSEAVIVNCTFSGNWSENGRAIACLWNIPSTVIAVNCILWDGGDEIANFTNSTIVVGYSDVFGGYSGTGNINSNPLFIDEFNHDFHLSSSSPCIDAGTAYFEWNGIQIVSLDSTSYFGSAPDMGAFEWDGGTTYVEGELSNNLSKEFALLQNFPNPFNPSTKIRYSITQTSDVTIKVFDILGNEIETLVNEEKPAGTYEVTWYAESATGGLPSGVYLYRIQAGSFVETKKMILLK